jgi:hypothetical protein
LPFTVEDLARTALVRILPRSRYRLAALTDARFASFASNAARIAYRQQGGTPAFLIFSGPGQDPRAVATAAAAWAEANWRPNAIQRKVRPGVVVVQVAPGNELTTSGLVTATAVPAAIWTVNSETGNAVVDGHPPGSPSGAEVRRAGAALQQGLPAPSLGELDHAERDLMQTRSIAMPQAMGGLVGLLLLVFAVRYGFGALFSVFAFSSLVTAPNLGSWSGERLVLYADLFVNILILVGIVLGAAVLFNFANLAFRLPGFSSPVPRTRTMTWVGYAVVMVGLAVVLDGVIPPAMSAGVRNPDRSQFMHLALTVDDDGTDPFVLVGGDVTVNLSGWPSSEWSGVQFKTSNPSVLPLAVAPAAGTPPMARFDAHQAGTSRIDAVSADGRYTFQVRVTVSP